MAAKAKSTYYIAHSQGLRWAINHRCEHSESQSSRCQQGTIQLIKGHRLESLER
jgi:hypothetical protein